MKIEIEANQKLVDMMGKAMLTKTLELACDLAATIIDQIGEKLHIE